MEAFLATFIHWGLLSLEWLVWGWFPLAIGIGVVLMFFLDQPLGDIRWFHMVVKTMVAVGMIWIVWEAIWWAAIGVAAAIWLAEPLWMRVGGFAGAVLTLWGGWVLWRWSGSIS